MEGTVPGRAMKEESGRAAEVIEAISASGD